MPFVNPSVNLRFNRQCCIEMIVPCDEIIIMSNNKGKEPLRPDDRASAIPMHVLGEHGAKRRKTDASVDWRQRRHGIERLFVPGNELPRFWKERRCLEVLTPAAFDREEQNQNQWRLNHRCTVRSLSFVLFDYVLLQYNTVVWSKWVYTLSDLNLL